MEIILSAALSLDGYIDDRGRERLKLSSPEDWAEIERLRAGCDAILVGAGTVRRDNPALVIKNEALRAERKRRGMNPDIAKVTVTGTGDLDPRSNFFTRGDGEKIVFVSDDLPSGRLAGIERTRIVRLDNINSSSITQYLEQAGYGKLLVEGGRSILTMFLREGMVDRLRLALAPFFVGDGEAPRFVDPGRFPWDKHNRLELEKVEKLGDMAVMHYRMTRIGTDEGCKGLKNREDTEDLKYLKMAVEESRKCTPSFSAYSVGAVVLTSGGLVFTGYSRESGPLNHAEEEAVGKALASGADLTGAVMYSSMEPCSCRKSKPKSCTELILENNFRKVVYALGEPSFFQNCDSAGILKSAGVEVVKIEEMTAEVVAVNSHILGGDASSR